MSRTLRPLVPPGATALLCTALLVLWLRARPVPMTPTVQVLLSVGLVVLVAIVLVLVRRIERDGVGQ